MNFSDYLAAGATISAVQFVRFTTAQSCEVWLNAGCPTVGPSFVLDSGDAGNCIAPDVGPGNSAICQGTAGVEIYSDTACTNFIGIYGGTECQEFSSPAAGVMFVAN